MTRSPAPFRRSVLPPAVAFAAIVLGASAARADETPPEAPKPAAETPKPEVVLSADARDATLERRVGTISPLGPAIAETGLLGVAQWERICVAPCGVRVDPRFLYRVAGDGAVPTSSFAVPRSADRVDVDAKLGSSPWRVGGAVAAGLGALGVLAGGAALAISPVLASEEVGSETFRTAVVAGGAGTLALGAIALGAGLYAFLANDSSVRVGSGIPRTGAAASR